MKHIDVNAREIYINNEKIGLNLPVGARLLFCALTGSHLYGVATETSDIDIQGVFVAPPENYIGYVHRCDQICKKVTVAGKDYDICLYDIKKYMQLAQKCNPNIIELLFIPEDKSLYWTFIWNKFLKFRDLFIHKKARYTFTGYAISQLKRIKGHKKWMDNPPKKPTREQFGLPDNKKLMAKDQVGAFNKLLSLYLEDIHAYHDLKEQLDRMRESTDYMAILQKLSPLPEHILKTLTPMSDNFIAILRKEQEYSKALKDYKDYTKWQANRNPKRAELETQFGYDTKHASHLYRLMDEGKEILTTGKLIFPRRNAKDLMAIRNGSVTYECILQDAENMDKRFDILYRESLLPYSPDIKAINKLLLDIILERGF